MSKPTHLLCTEGHTEILREEVWLALDRRARAAVVDTSVVHLWAWLAPAWAWVSAPPWGEAQCGVSGLSQIYPNLRETRRNESMLTCCPFLLKPNLLSTTSHYLSTFAVALKNSDTVVMTEKQGMRSQTEKQSLTSRVATQEHSG